MRSGVLPVAAAFLIFAASIAPALSGDIYWEGEEDSSQEFLELNDDHHEGFSRVLDRVRRGFWDFLPTFTTTSPTPDDHVDEEVGEDLDNNFGSGALPDREIDTREKTLRVSFVVMEPYELQYSNRDSEQFQNLSKSLADAVNVLYESLKGTQRASLVRIQSRPADEFSCKVTLDIVTTGNEDTDRITQILRDHIRTRRSLGAFTVSDADFNATVIDPSVVLPECGSNEIVCDDGHCVRSDARCDNVRDCPDGSDEQSCPMRTDNGRSQQSENRQETAPPVTTTRSPWSESFDVNTEPEPELTNPKENAVPECEDPIPCSGSTLTVCLEKMCDGIPDCPQGDDEYNCKRTSYDDNVANNGDQPRDCERDELRCDETRCVQLSRMCDGVRDCYDGKDERDCIEQCGEDDFRCSINNKCVESYRRCDGHFDCPDGEDERQCVCKENEFRCVSDGSCIEMRKKCDGVNHCIDRSDEENCNEHVCRDRGRFRCGDGTCITILLRCDGFVDCPNDRLDEANCPCGSGKWQCDHGSCIKRSQRCDGRVDCPSDRSDERNCFTAEIAYFTCWSGKRIPESLRCNRRYDCPPGDYSDEKNCPCGKGDFKCDNGFCIAAAKRCDRTHDCQDGSDERNCIHAAAHCMASEYKCSNGECVLADARCNGIRECADGSDEVSCPCQRDQFRCRDGACISSAALCNGARDCTQGEDERNCDVCASSLWRCRAGGCVSKSSVCDGRSDCADGSDEAFCTSPNQLLSNITRRIDCPEDSITCNDDRTCAKRCDGRVECPNSEDEEGCDDAPCSHWCDGQCIEDSQICNSVQDCSDGSDERDCDPCDGPNDFRCNDGQCVNAIQRCNGIEECEDGSDEFNCNNTIIPDYESCNENQFTCRDGTCINKQFRCDRHFDCNDNSDEEGCTPEVLHEMRPYRALWRSVAGAARDDAGEGSTTTHPPACLDSDFTCYNGRCIPHAQRCDNIYDCLDFSDEQNCYHSACDEDSWQCTSGQCVPKYSVCDGWPNCSDRSDELNCATPGPPLEPVTAPPTPARPVYTTAAPRLPPNYRPYLPQPQDGCEAHEWRCENGPCIPARSRCDGRLDCPRDDSDELDCPNGTPAALNLRTVPDSQSVRYGGDVVFQCRDEGPARAPVRWVREGGRPLKPGSTDRNGRLEMYKVTVSDSGVYICQAPTYLGQQGSELRVSLQVESRSTTYRPPFIACQAHEATCGNGQCIPKTAVCDGKADCSDRSDEDACNFNGLCEPNQYQCPNRHCILKSWVCDAEDDCGDGADERDCAPAPPGQLCKSTEFACHDRQQCIPRSFHCDAQHDCLDKSDEVGCAPVHVKVPPRPQNVRLNTGDTLRLTCEAVGVPTPFITWRLNWGHVPDQCRSTSINGVGTLVCPDMQSTHSGAYSCEAINNKGTNFAVPDAIVYVNQTDICPPGYFNSVARSPSECIRCFCFGESTQCSSADLFTFTIPTPLGEGGTRLLGVTSSYTGEARVDPQPITDLYYYQPLRNGAVVTKLELYATRASKPYIALPESYNGNQLTSYGGAIRYRLQPHSDKYGYDDNVPDIIVKGKYGTLVHYTNSQNRGYVEAPLLPGSWQKAGPRGPTPASREDIMMALDNIEMILLRAEQNGAGVNITEFAMESAQRINTGLGPANLVEECRCPPGYQGLSCEKCASGYVRESSGPWLGNCVQEERTCPPGTYGDPNSGLGCRPCPCPLTNRENQFARTCSLSPSGRVVCDCMPGYEGPNCGVCSSGYIGNPTIPGDSCRPPPSNNCNPIGTSAVRLPDQCTCKDNVRGRYCDSCSEDSFFLSPDFRHGCAQCFCSGVTQQCTSSNLRRKTTTAMFNTLQASRQVKVYKSNPVGPPGALRYNQPIETDENSYGQRTNDGKDTIYYWSLPATFSGDKVTAYGGYLNYVLQNVESNQYKNTAPDIQLISETRLTFQYYGNFVRNSDGYLNATVQLLEKGWQRSDGKEVSREHFLLALADVKVILIKATYSGNSEPSLVSASIETAEANGDGPQALHVEQCVCPTGYIGTSCEDCAPGYTRSGSGLYLEHCEPCNCNGHSDMCHPETGECYDCSGNREGEFCDRCKPGYERDRYDNCVPSGPSPDSNCNCDPRGEASQCVDGRCVCKANVEGQYCDQCRSGSFGLSRDNPDGCLACYCSGVTTECYEAMHYTVLPIPAPVFGEDYGGYTLMDLNAEDVINEQFVPVTNESELVYVFSEQPRRQLYWSLPVFPGNRILSYGGSLSLTQKFETGSYIQTSTPGNDVVLVGDQLTIFWTNPNVLRSGEPLAYQVPLREDGWHILNTAEPVSRSQFLNVLRNLRRVLVRATPGTGSLVSTTIADVSMDTAADGDFDGEPAKGIEVCRCPEGYTGTSCETCTSGFYQERGQCRPCPCNGHECQVGPYGNVVCQCRPPYTGADCSSVGGESSTLDTSTRPPPPQSTVVVVISGPTIKIQEIGGSVNFTCTAQSRLSQRPLTVSWSKTDGYLPQERSYSTRDGFLMITNVQPSDSGLYVCQATDGVSTEQAHATLQVPGNAMTLPVVSIKPTYNEIYEGERIELECYATGTPTPRITWQRATGRALPVTAETYEGFYIIDRATENDSGEYRCTATNSAGSVDRTAVITVRPNPSRPNRPLLTVTPTAVSVNEGQSARVVCSGTGNIQPASIDWIRQDGTDLLPNVRTISGVLYIEGATLDNQGVYVCQSSSPEVVPVPVLVNVNPIGTPAPSEASRVIVKEERLVIPSGGSGVIDCTPAGYPLPQISWKKYQGEFGPSTSQRDNSLVIANAQMDDQGYYVCEGTVGGRPAADVYVFVEIENREPPRVEIWPQGEQAAPLGGDFQFHCRVLGGVPEPTVMWGRSDGRPYAAHVSIQPNNVLRFERIEVNDEGEYTCSATNVAGTSSAGAVLKVRSPPVITLTPGHEVRGYFAEPINVDCRASGYPEPTVTISKVYPEFRELVPPTPLTAALGIASASELDDGTYTCTASSVAGITEDQFQISVDRGDGGAGDFGSGEDPEFNQIPYEGQPESLRVSEGQDTTIICNTTENDAVIWSRRDGRPLQSNALVEGNVLRIIGTSLSDAGYYECTHRDPYTNQPRQVIMTYLQVLRPPRITLRPPTQTVRPGQSPTVECVVEGDDNPQVVWRPLTAPFSRRVEVRGPLLVFNHIEIEDAGQYECFARNQVANTSAAAEVIVNEELSRPAQESHDHEQFAHVGATVYLRCNVSQPNLKIRWTKDGRPVPKTVRTKSDGSLVVRIAQRSDTGRYVCHIQDPYGQKTVNYINLHIEGPPDVSSANLVTIDQPNRVFTVGENVEVRCRARSRDVRVTWERYGTMQFVDARPYGDGSMLVLHGVEESDAGVYRCTGTDSYGHTSSEDFNLEVAPGSQTNYPAEIHSADEQVYEANVSSRIVMPCRHNLVEPVTIEWRREYLPLSPKIDTHRPYLSINGVRESDAGTYICRVRNQQSTAEARAVLRVLGVVPRFDGDSWLALDPLKDAYQQFDIEISFKPTDPNGLLLYNSQNQGRDGDYIALQLIDGIPQFIMDSSSGPLVVEGDRPLQLNAWHTVRISPVKSKVTMDVDNTGPFTKEYTRTWDLLELNQPMYIGGVPDYNQLPSKLAGTSGFVGCVSMLIRDRNETDLMAENREVYNVAGCDTCKPNPCLNRGICQEARNERGFVCHCPAGQSGVDCGRAGEGCRPGLCGPGKCQDTSDGYKCSCPVTYSGRRCENKEVIEYPAFTGGAFVAIKYPENHERWFALSLKVKATSPVTDGVVMYCAENSRGHGGFTSLTVKDGHLQFRYDLGDGSGPVILTSRMPLTPNEWTSVLLARMSSRVTMNINNIDSVDGTVDRRATLALKTPLFVGGYDDSIVLNNNTGVTGGFKGCIKDLELFKVQIDIVNSAVQSSNVLDCSAHSDRGDIPEVCSQCLNNGYCLTSDATSCTCRPGFTGQYCETVVPRQPPARSQDPCAAAPCRNGGTCRPERTNRLNYTCDCPLGFSGTNCHMRLDLLQSVGFNGNGYLELPAQLVRYDNLAYEDAVIAVAVQTTTDGVLVYQGELAQPGYGDYLLLMVENGRVVLEWNLGDGPSTLSVNEVVVTDGERHRIIVKLKNNRQAFLEVDGYVREGQSNGFTNTMNADSNIYIGGIPDAWNVRRLPGLTGCFDQVEVMNEGRGLNLGQRAVAARNTQRCREALFPDVYPYFEEVDVFESPPSRAAAAAASPATSLAILTAIFIALRLS